MIVLALCLVPIVLFAITAYLVLRSLKRAATIDTARLEQRYGELRAAHPRESQADLLRRIIRREAVRTGVIGAITGFGGFFTLIIALPIDMLTSTRIQAELVNFIAASYGRPPGSPTEVQFQRYLVMAGGARLTRFADRLLLDFALRFVSKTLAKFIPFIGAFLSFGVNYFFTQASGNLALEWYSGNLVVAGRRLAPPPRMAAATPDLLDD